MITTMTTLFQHKNALLGLSAFALLATGCDKEKLSPIPQTVLSDASAFSTPARIQQQIFGVYSNLKSGQFLGGRAHVYQEVRGEDWVNITTNGVTAFGVWNFTVSDNDNQVENYWSAGFANINRANVVIEGVTANASAVGTATANSYIAEARFCRALSFFYLQSLYARRAFNQDPAAASVPLRLTANKSPEGANLARATQTQVFAQILDDLNFAETNAPVSYGAVGDSNVVRATKASAIAFKMRVYMHMNRWSDVITEGNKLVSASAPFVSPGGRAFALTPSVLTAFRAPYTTSENIFSLPMTNTNAPGTQNGLGQYWTSEFALNTAGIIADAAWKTTDARRVNFQSATTPPIRWTKFNDDLTNYVPILRYAETMLNLAEALARNEAGTAVNARALALLNAVRQRSDATTTFAPADKNALIALILNERRIELLGEGFRSLDVMRQVGTFGAKGSVGAVAPSVQSYVWPIPASELQLNSLMTPNN